MSEILNQNRYVFTSVKSDIVTFKRFVGTNVYYLLKKINEKIYIKDNNKTIDREVDFLFDSSRLQRKVIGNIMSLSEMINGDPAVSILGGNPDKFYDFKLDCNYYTYLDGTSWANLGYDSCITDAFPSFSILITVSSGEMFFIFQEDENISIYQIGISSIVKKCEMNNFYLLDAKSINNDILIIAIKNNINYPSEFKYEELISKNYNYYSESPCAFKCTFSSSYESFVEFCENKSIFPVVCSRNRELNSFFLLNKTLYCLSTGVNSNGKFIPIVGVGNENDINWRYPNDVKPFGDLENLNRLNISVDLNGTMYVIGSIGKKAYVSYYCSSYNKWKNYDKDIILSFEDSKISSSSSSCSSSGSLSSSSCSSSSSIAPAYNVIGAGTALADGVYHYSGIHLGQGEYTNYSTSYKISYYNGVPYEWAIVDDSGAFLYYNNVYGPVPPLFGWNVALSGMVPAPILSEV